MARPATCLCSLAHHPPEHLESNPRPRRWTFESRCIGEVSCLRGAFFRILRNSVFRVPMMPSGLLGVVHRPSRAEGGRLGGCFRVLEPRAGSGAPHAARLPLLRRSPRCAPQGRNLRGFYWRGLSTNQKQSKRCRIAPLRSNPVNLKAQISLLRSCNLLSTRAHVQSNKCDDQYAKQH